MRSFGTACWTSTSLFDRVCNTRSPAGRCWPSCRRWRPSSRSTSPSTATEPLAGILRARGWIYAGVGALGLVAVFQRTQWLAALDRRFFREQYDSLRVLREVIDEIQQSRSIDEVAARVVARIETALHPEFVAVMVREATGREYRCFASVPAGQACPPIDVNSKLVALLGVLGEAARGVAGRFRLAAGAIAGTGHQFRPAIPGSTCSCPSGR